MMTSLLQKCGIYLRLQERIGAIGKGRILLNFIIQGRECYIIPSEKRKAGFL
ncbi:hypothetical protein ACE6H2_010847 [Prunus campanulata]